MLCFYRNGLLNAAESAMAVSSESDSAAAHNGVSDSIVTEFSTYEDFLDSQITPTDLYYLEVRSTLMVG